MYSEKKEDRILRKMVFNIFVVFIFITYYLCDTFYFILKYGWEVL